MIEWEDLLTVPFVRGGRTMGGLDCAGVAEEINIRCGCTVPQAHLFPNAADTRNTREAFADYMAAAEKDFELVGRYAHDANVVGDFIVTDPRGHDIGAHIYTLAAIKPRVLLHAVAGRGITTVDVRRVRNIIGVYRIRRAI